MMGVISHPPTSTELLDLALGHTAPRLVRVLEQALRRQVELERIIEDEVGRGPDAVAVDVDAVLVKLANAVSRRVYIAKKDRDAELTDVLDDDAERLDKALDQQATRVVQLLTEALPDRTGLLRELALAIGDRIEAATRQHDQEIAQHLDDAAARIRARYDFERQVLAPLDDEACAGDEDPDRTARLVHLLGDDLIPACGGDDDPGPGWIEATVMADVTCPGCRRVPVAPAQLDHKRAAELEVCGVPRCVLPKGHHGACPIAEPFTPGLLTSPGITVRREELGEPSEASR